MENVKPKFNDKGELLAAELLVYDDDEGEEYFLRSSHLRPIMH